jgi:hypothetical protein
MGTKIEEVVCDEHGIGGDREYFGDNDAQLGRINGFYHEASGGKYVPRAVPFGLEPGVFGAVSASPLGELFRSGSLVKQNAGAGKNWAKAHYHYAKARILPKRRRGMQMGQGLLLNSWAPVILTPPPCSVAAFVVNSKPTPGHFPRCVCV